MTAMFQKIFGAILNGLGTQGAPGHGSSDLDTGRRDVDRMLDRTSADVRKDHDDWDREQRDSDRLRQDNERHRP
jgi:hypothetical protein